MPLFVCDKCGAIENTALGHYWSRSAFKYKDSSLNGKALCSECAPLYFESGQRISSNTGKWHGKFPKEFYDPEKHKDSELLNKPESKKEK